jgi:FADH2 O2-dependent halogenase
LSELFDIAVIGSGFAGSLLAMITKRLGRSVILIERGRHPRFAIGESSTPLANLLLEDLARRYDLPRILPLAKWGTWQSAYPEIGCGIKRGFSFYHHRLGEDFVPDADHSNQLLVGASPHDGVADTHWYRPDFDAFLVKQAQGAGVEYADDVTLSSAEWRGEHALLRGTRGGLSIEFRARWVVDATGPRGFLHRALGLAERPFPWMPPTQSLYGHFTGVERLSEAAIASTGAPYPPEDAAVHHVFDGGWIWVLRFNNGVTSGGVAAIDNVASRLRLDDGEPAWKRLLGKLPTVGSLFRAATPLRPFTYVPRLSFLTATMHGQWWAMLPSAAGFVDPLLSTGFPLTLLGITRLAGVLERDWRSDRFTDSLAEYARQSENELVAAASLIAALYKSTGRFRTFTSLCMLYFAAASFAEASHRLGARPLPGSFLLHDHPTFGPALRRLCERVISAESGGFSDREDADFADEVRRAIEPINIAGLCDPGRRNWYPADANDLIAGAAKLGATPQEVTRMIPRLNLNR